MERLTTCVAVAAFTLLWPAASSAITFSQWATSQGYDPNVPLPAEVDASSASIDSLSGIEAYDWTTTPTTKLNLGYNQISSIEPDDFNTLPSLELLYLHGNNISSIEAGDFSALPNLKGLYIGGNISSLDAADFSGLSNLSVLGLYGNQISSIEPGDFSGLTNLTYLALQKNQLSSIEPGDFDGLTHLTALDLDDNQIGSIEPDDFAGLTDLTWLILGANQLSSIDAGDFDRLPNLVTLALDSNQLSNIESGAFSGLSHLTFLGLYGNQLTSIEAGAFRGLPNLQGLDLEHNPTLSELNLAEADFSNLTFFYVDYNVNVTSVSLRGTILSQSSFQLLMESLALLDWDDPVIAPGGGATITELDLSRIDFANITDLVTDVWPGASWPFFMTDLNQLWLVGTENLDAVALDEMLDKMPAMESTDIEGVLYMTRADYNSFNTAGGGLLESWHNEPGHHVAFVPEPATLLLCCVASGVSALARKRGASWDG